MVDYQDLFLRHRLARWFHNEETKIFTLSQQFCFIISVSHPKRNYTSRVMLNGTHNRHETSHNIREQRSERRWETKSEHRQALKAVNDYLTTPSSGLLFFPSLSSLLPLQQHLSLASRVSHKHSHPCFSTFVTRQYPFSSLVNIVYYYIYACYR